MGDKYSLSTVMLQQSLLLSVNHHLVADFAPVNASLYKFPCGTDRRAQCRSVDHHQRNPTLATFQDVQKPGKLCNTVTKIFTWTPRH